LLTPRPSPFMVLNEPETSIHFDLLKPMADLITAASENSQILLTTHSKELARALRLKGATTYELEKIDGATCLRGKRKVRTQEQKMRGWLGPETDVMEDE
jgi:predicted ATPase